MLPVMRNTSPAPWITRHIWLAGIDLDTELRQAEQEGRDLRRVAALAARLRRTKPGTAVPLDRGPGARWLAAYFQLIDRVQTLPRRRGFPYCEPSDLAGIRRERPAAVRIPRWTGNRREFLRRLHGGLLGRICGCMLGKPVEGWLRQDIRLYAETTGNWPLADYLRKATKAEAKRMEGKLVRSRVPTVSDKNACLRPEINGMVEDDDTNYTVTGFGIVKRHGRDFTPEDVASFWLREIPILHTCTAERTSYRSLCMGIPPPQSASWRNPYREWIGAQIRADYFGYANPGNPARAAAWAWRDAAISHVGNGIYGEMWVAAMLAAAYVEKDMPRIVRAGLAQVPADCRLREDVEMVLELHAAGIRYEDAVEFVHKQWDERKSHDWCHTNSNAQIVAIGLLYGGDDYGLAISRSVMPGFDTDCNGATVGSVWGVRYGVNRIPARWAGPIRNRLRTGVSGYHDVAIDELAQEMVDVALRTA
jgi:ADP-ribosylglycohydrolase